MRINQFACSGKSWLLHFKRSSRVSQSSVSLGLWKLTSTLCRENGWESEVMLQKTGVVYNYKHPLGWKESILIHAKVPLKAFFFSEFQPYLRMFTIVSFIFWLSDVLPVQVLPLVLPVQCPLLLIWALAGFQDFNCGGVATQLVLLSQEHGKDLVQIGSDSQWVNTSQVLSRYRPVRDPFS